MYNFSQVCDFFVKNNKTKTAIHIVDELQSLANNLEHYYFLGFAYKNLAEYEKAIYYFNKCLEGYPAPDLKNQIYLNVGMCYADSMQTEKGLEYLRKCDSSIDTKELIPYIERRNQEIKNIQSTGYWTDHSHHLHSTKLAAWISQLFDPKLPVHDLGCGMGFYLAELKKNGFKNLTGYEGEPSSKSLFDNIVKQDITKPIKCKAKGNVICLEVAEHIPKEFTLNLFDSIKKCCKNILVTSWAVRGQMGIGHVNCKNNDEVIDMFQQHKFAFDLEATEAGRAVIDHECDWFKKSLLVFRKV